MNGNSSSPGEERLVGWLSGICRPKLLSRVYSSCLFIPRSFRVGAGHPCLDWALRIGDRVAKVAL